MYLIVAIDQNNGIGQNGLLPWRLKDDMRFFQETTSKISSPDKQNVVIMGRTTWESIPEGHRPLKNRINFVLTRNPDYQAAGAQTFNSLEQSLQNIPPNAEKIFIIGGGQLFHETIKHPQTEGIYITQLQHTFDCDTFFPQLPAEFKNYEILGTVEENGLNYEYRFYQKI